MLKGLVTAAVLSAALSASASAVDELLAQAIAANEKAQSQGHEWTVTAKAIKAAQSALADGNDELALQLAEKAKFIAEASAFQASSEVDNWQARVPK